MRQSTLLIAGLLLGVTACSEVQAQPDLQIGQIVYRGDQISVRVRNTGNQVSGPCKVFLRVVRRSDSRDLINRHLDLRPVPPGGSRLVVVDRVPFLANAALATTADAFNQVRESNEGNNSRTQGIAFAGRDPRAIDLEVTRITIHSPTQISVTVRNNGPLNLNRPVTLQLRGTVNGSTRFQLVQTLPRLDRGKQNIRLFNIRPGLLPRGSVVRAFVDSSRFVGESNESNNIRTVIFR